MREIVLDTETTGFDAEKDDRIVEIGALELINHLPTGRTFHVYINPGRPMPQEAFEIHGLGDDFLRDKPGFAEIAQSFVDFVAEDARLVIHNASFDMKFLNAELRRAGFPTLPWSRALDTLALAREKFPGSPSSLDALCRRFGVDNSNRDLHGALLDSELLAEVYLELIGGRQQNLGLSAEERKIVEAAKKNRRPPRPHAPTDAEQLAHAQFIEKLESPIWKSED